MDREKLFKLTGMVRDIQEMGEGKDGFPFVDINMSNDPYIGGIRVEIMDHGYKAGSPYDGCYVFKNIGGVSERVYRNCIKHLEEIKEIAEGFFK